MLEKLAEKLLSIPTILICVGAIFMTLKTRFVQFRGIGKMFSALINSMRSSKNGDDQTIQAHKALLTAMSTTLGTATIASPIVTMQLGGPGALFFFLLSTIFGSALTFTEVTLAVDYRKKLDDGTIMGGPMQYLKKAISPLAATWYATFGFLLLLVWSGLQSNILANLMVNYHIPAWSSGITLSVLVTITLISGIKQIGNISAKIVPFMFFLYTAATLYIIFVNIFAVPEALGLIMRGALTPKAIIGGSAFGGMMHAIRVGVLKGMNAHEAGIGTGTIPHSMAETNDPAMQGLLAMASTYSQGFLSLLTGLVVILTGTWKGNFGMNALALSFSMYFSFLGPLILAISIFLFGFGTILGNSYNGSQCYLYITKNRYINFYYISIAILTFVGAIAPVESMWIIPDFFLVLVALPNIVGILVLSFMRKNLLTIK